MYPLLSHEANLVFFFLYYVPITRLSLLVSSLLGVRSLAGQHSTDVEGGGGRSSALSRQI